MMQKFSKSELEAKSIFEMRALAKEVGISAPTKMNKAELVDMVFKITNGEIEPPQAPRRGRPKKYGDATEQTTSEKPQIAQNLAQPEQILTPSPAKVEVIGEISLPKGFERPKYQPTRQFAQQNQKQYSNNGFNQNNYGQKQNNFRNQNQNQVQRDNVIAERKDDEETEQIREGYLEINPDGYGFLRVKNGEFNEMDAYVSAMKIKQYGLRRGDYVTSLCKKVQEGRPSAVVSVTTINGIESDKVGKRPNFDDLVPIYPDERIRLEVAPREFATRCIDLVSPIGKGQRGIIVSPPKAGKTTLLKMIASSIATNYPDIELKVLLIDERPEEVTDMQRSIKGEVVYSTFDELPEHHTKTAEMLLERAKRLVEMGKDVVILLDSLTRLARAYNLTIPPTGRTLSGGIDPGALHSPKRFFGSARNIENGGSLTIIATALVDTGSRMDDVIFEEFKGTGNMEIHLDRRLSEKRIFPAIDLAKSGTRKEELLLTPSELEGTWGIRKLLSNADNAEATENLINMIVKTSSNKEFIDQLNLQLRVLAKEGYTVRSLK
ncbi:transcription termination factor Rho [Firmicutes bacterium CAG:475]|jgi:transcription termination factor rho|nr:transcription termination factor Rho [Clostridia bacterium]CDD69130.1 transcription termination factor Rho [Firmicutes bacterium CAG:475]